jgi:hypothetical protein
MDFETDPDDLPPADEQVARDRFDDETREMMECEPNLVPTLHR